MASKNNLASEVMKDKVIENQHRTKLSLNNNINNNNNNTISTAP